MGGPWTDCPRYKVMAWFVVVAAILAPGGYMAMSVTGYNSSPPGPSSTADPARRLIQCGLIALAPPYR